MDKGFLFVAALSSVIGALIGAEVTGIIEPEIIAIIWLILLLSTLTLASLALKHDKSKIRKGE